MLVWELTKYGLLPALLFKGIVVTAMALGYDEHLSCLKGIKDFCMKDYPSISNLLTPPPMPCSYKNFCVGFKWMVSEKRQNIDSQL